MLKREQVLVKLREYHELSLVDPDTAHSLADSVLLDYINDQEIRTWYRYATRHDVLSEIAMFRPAVINEETNGE